MRKLRIFFAVTAMAAQFVGTSASAATWKLVAISGSNGYYEIDRDSIRTTTSGYPSKNIVIAWFRADYSKDKSINYRESKFLYHFSCAESEYKLVQYINYGADGTVVNSGSPSNYFKAAAPDTVGYSLLEAACYGKDMAGDAT